jgi:hypothetical protein
MASDGIVDRAIEANGYTIGVVHARVGQKLVKRNI